MIRANIMHANSDYSLSPLCRNTCSPMHNSSRMGREILRRSVMVRFTHYAVASTSCHTRIVLCTPPSPPPPTLSLRHSVTLQTWRSPAGSPTARFVGSLLRQQSHQTTAHTRTQSWLRTGVSCPSDRYCVRWVIKCGVLQFLSYVIHMAHILMFYVTL